MTELHPLEIITQLRMTKGKNAKRDILRANKDNEQLQLVLKLAYDKTICFYQTKIPKKGPEIYIKGPVGLKDIDNLLRIRLATRELSGKHAKDSLFVLWFNLNERDKSVLELIIKRDIKAGISIGSIKAVWEELVPYFPYMRCEKKGTLQAPYLSELKSDGVFSRWFVKHDRRGTDITANTRNGTPLINLPEYMLSDFEELDTAVYEGEMVIYRDGVLLPREIGNGLINKYFIHGSKNIPSNEKLHVVLWDKLPEEDYWKGLCETRRIDRLEDLEDLISYGDVSAISLVPYQISNSEWEATAFYQAQLAAGLEGSIDKDLDAPWKDGTSKLQIKRKIEEIVELRMVALKPAREGSKNESIFGSLLCKSECGKLRVAATGITDEMRQYIYDNWEFLKGTVTSIKGNFVMPPSKSNPLYSLFLPRFVELRNHEKDTADTLEEIIEAFDQNKENS